MHNSALSCYLRVLTSLAATWAAPANTAQVHNPQLAKLTTSIETRRTEHIDVLSPRNFEAALEAYEAARKDAERGRNPERIRERIGQAEASLERAAQAAAAARQVLSSVIKARE